VLPLLDRNMKLKAAPERWQDQRNVFDVVVTFEERVFDSIVEGLLLLLLPAALLTAVLACRLSAERQCDVPACLHLRPECEGQHRGRHHRRAALRFAVHHGIPFLSLPLYDLQRIHASPQLEGLSDWEDRIDEIVSEVQKKLGRPLLHSVQFY
jgi:hypothetical protein